MYNFNVRWSICVSHVVYQLQCERIIAPQLYTFRILQMKRYENALKIDILTDFIYRISPDFHRKKITYGLFFREILFTARHFIHFLFLSFYRRSSFHQT